MAKQEVQKGMIKKPFVKSKKRHARTIPSGIAHVKATFNNTITAITDLSGNVVASGSAAKANFTGSRKSSALPQPRANYTRL